MPFERLWNSLRHATDPVARQALILATDPFRSGQRTADDASDVTGYLQQLAASSPHQSDRSAARTVLRGWGVELKAPSRDVSEVPQRLAQRNWWVNEQGITMVILELPVYASGPQALVAGREEEASAGPKSRTHLFAISSTEVSREQLLRCQQSFPFLLEGPEDHTWPANNVFSVVAMQYCRWLSERSAEGFDEVDMCYPERNRITTDHLQLSDEQLRKTSYRLPTEAEWEYACSSGTATPWSHGSSDVELLEFCCCAGNSRGKLFPVGSLYPNAWGIYDMHGNVAEWCHPAPSATGNYALRGGNYTVPTSRTKSRSLNYPGSKGYSFTGFRIARTILRTDSGELK